VPASCLAYFLTLKMGSIDFHRVISRYIPEGSTYRRSDWFTSVKNLVRFMKRPEIFD
jgi:hypothetical protein